MLYYILVGKNPHPIPLEQSLEWGRWMEMHTNNGSRHVGSLRIPPRKPFRKGNPKMLHKINKRRAEPIFVSTVFLGLDHNHWGGKPILFETMVFGGKYDDFQHRYHTWDEAAKKHKEVVEMVTEGMVL